MPSSRRGVTLVELMVAVSIISLGLLAFTGAFRFITHSIRDARAKTLAISLAQEKIENLKNISYHKLQITTVPFTGGADAYFGTDFNPDFNFDTISYPPETIRIGGITFTRTVDVKLTRLIGNEVQSLSANYPDSGLKFLTCNITWQQRGEWKNYFIDSVYENPLVDPLNATLQGRVRDVDGNALGGAVVTVLEKADWTGAADSAGSYLFRVHGGTYSIRASSAGYYDQTWTQNIINEGVTFSTSFALLPVGTGTVSGNVFFSSHLVIAQVVAATETYTGDMVLRDVEYTMLFNPTTYTINVGSQGVTWALWYYNHQTSTWTGPGTLMATTVSTYVPPHTGYIVASSSWFMIANQWIRADAFYADPAKDYLTNDDAGMVLVYKPSGSFWSEKVSWADDDTNPVANSQYYETTYIPDNACTDGIGRGNFLVRYASPTTIGEGLYGWAYDSGNNPIDFVGPHSVCGSIPLPLMNWDTVDPIRPTGKLMNSTQTVIGGVPAVGAFVIADDLLGPTTTAWRDTVTNDYGQAQPYARYSLEGVSTGTWNVLIATGSRYIEISSVTVPHLAGVSIPNSATVPPEPDSGVYVAYASMTAAGGYISGFVQDINGVPLPNISVIAGGESRTTSSNGRFFAAVAAGPQSVIVNVNNANPAYQESIILPTVTLGSVSTMTVTLTQAGVLMGYLTPDGSSGLPNVEVTAKRAEAQWGAGVSDTSGNFYIKNLSTGTYDIAPVLDPLETFSPSSYTVTVNANRTIHVGTFTITAAQGKLSGSVSHNGTTLTTGALILVSTRALTETPPLIVASSAPAQATIFAASSKADGTYLVEVRGSTSTAYRVHVYVPTVGSDSVSISTKVYTSVMVYSTGTTTLDISVP